MLVCLRYIGALDRGSVPTLGGSALMVVQTPRLKALLLLV